MMFEAVRLLYYNYDEWVDEVQLDGGIILEQINGVYRAFKHNDQNNIVGEFTIQTNSGWLSDCMDE